MLKSVNENAWLAETMTEAELFRCFLDAPVRNLIGESTLVPLSEEIDETMSDRFMGYFCGCAPYFEGTEELILDHLRDSEDPSAEIWQARSDLPSIADGFKMLEREFDLVKRLALLAPPEDDEALRKSNFAPRYALPSCAQTEKVSQCHAAQD